MILTGDSATLLQTIDSDSIDLTVTSPPYDGIRLFHGHSWDFDSIAIELFRVTKPGGVVCWVVQDQTKNFRKSLTSFRQAIRFCEIGFGLLDTIIWEKPSGAPFNPFDRCVYAPRYEFIHVLTRGRPNTFHPLRDRPNVSAGKKNRNRSNRQPDGSIRSEPPLVATIPEYGNRTNVWTVQNSAENNDPLAKQHPARFPIRLAQDLILSYTNPGDTVLDPFLGSGTTAIAAIRTQREFLGIEIASEYVALAELRIAREQDSIDENTLYESDRDGSRQNP